MSQSHAVRATIPTEDAGPILHEKAAPSSDFATMLREVALSGGKTYFAQVREIYALKFGRGKVSPIEYYHYGMYEDELTPSEKAAFVGHNLRAELNRQHLDSNAFAIGTDKLAFYARAAELDLPTPTTLAVCHADRTMAGAAAIRTNAELADFLREPSAYPLFAKPNSLSASVGSASVTCLHAATDEIELSDGARFPVSRFVEEAGRYFAGGYLIQRRLRPHAEIARVCGDTLSTVRMMVLDAGDGPKLIRATWRAPVGAHGADVLWRGNLMADVHLDTGVAIRAIRGRGLDRETVDAHPETGAAIVGAMLPCWREACDLAVRAAACFPELPLTGWDVAITDCGPVVVELEPDGGDPSVTQLASGRGLLDGPYGDWLKTLRKRRR